MSLRHTAFLLALLALATTGATCGMVAINSPVDGTTFTSAQTVTIASDVGLQQPADATVTKVEFSDNGALKCTDLTAPYQCSWPVTSAQNGGHSWVSKAFLSNTAVWTSAPVALTVAIGVAPPSGDPALVGFLPGIGTAMDVAVDGAEAFVASADFGVSVVDVANPSAAQVIASADEPFEGKSVAVRGNRAVVVGESESGTAEFRVLDVSTADPVVVGELATTLTASNANDVALNAAGTRAVAAMGSAGLWVIDLSNPAAPRLQGTYNTPGFAYGVELNSTASIAYLADGTGDLQIVSLSNPAAPTLLGSLSLSGIMRDVALSGTIAYLADQQGTLKVADVSSPAAPRFVGGVALAGFPTRLAVSGSLLVAVLDGDSSTLNVLSITNPTSPALRSSIAVGPPGSRVALAGTLAFVAAGNEGFKVYDLSNAASPSLAASVATPGDARDVSLESGSLALVADSAATLGVIDLAP